MGCDIHLHTEVKIDGNWHHYGKPSIERDYNLFALMAGVRDYNNITPISAPKGIPDDATFLTKYDLERYGRDAHTPSWFNSKEIARLYKWVAAKMGLEHWRIEREYWGYLFGNGWEGFHKHPEDYPRGLEDVRFIFWFDN